MDESADADLVDGDGAGVEDGLDVGQREAFGAFMGLVFSWAEGVESQATRTGVARGCRGTYCDLKTVARSARGRAGAISTAEPAPSGA